MADRFLQAISDAAHHLNQLEERARASRRIPRLMGLIDGIAFRTNLLVLSVAVERAEAVGIPLPRLMTSNDEPA